MTRMDELQARLGKWATANPDLDADALSDEEWAALLRRADGVAAENQKWFKIGIARAINEIKSKNADGSPLWPSRQALIAHLSKINEPC